MKKIFFAGSFNPFTRGHADIARRLLRLADTLVIGIGVNSDKPESEEAARANARAVSEWLRRVGLADRAEAVVYRGLTAEEALRRNADCLARGVRNATDFDYEYSLAAVNRDAFGIETILVPASPDFSFVSSTAIRDLEYYGRGDLASKYLPEERDTKK